MAELEKIVMYGASWCPDARRARKFFDERSVSYQWHDIEEDPAAKAFVEKTNNGKVVIPVIVFPDGGILVEPSNEEMAQKLGTSE
jgi:glutaredoxin